MGDNINKDYRLLVYLKNTLEYCQFISPAKSLKICRVILVKAYVEAIDTKRSIDLFILYGHSFQLIARVYFFKKRLDPIL